MNNKNNENQLKFIEEFEMTFYGSERGEEVYIDIDVLVEELKRLKKFIAEIDKILLVKSSEISITIVKSSLKIKPRIIRWMKKDNFANDSDNINEIKRKSVNRILKEYKKIRKKYDVEDYLEFDEANRKAYINKVDGTIEEVDYTAAKFAHDEDPKSTSEHLAKKLDFVNSESISAAKFEFNGIEYNSEEHEMIIDNNDLISMSEKMNLFANNINKTRYNTNIKKIFFKKFIASSGFYELKLNWDFEGRKFTYQYKVPESQHIIVDDAISWTNENEGYIVVENFSFEVDQKGKVTNIFVNHQDDNYIYFKHEITYRKDQDNFI